MSTQNPFQSEPVLCSTNWYTRLACKLQKMVEPLCEKRSDFALNAYETKCVIVEAAAIDIDLCRFLLMGFFLESPSVAGVNFAVKAWEDLEHQSVVWSPEVTRILAPRLTPCNKLGLAVWKVFSVGTSCSCCWAYRLIAVVVGSFSIGFLTRSLL